VGDHTNSSKLVDLEMELGGGTRDEDEVLWDVKPFAEVVDQRRCELAMDQYQINLDLGIGLIEGRDVILQLCRDGFFRFINVNDLEIISDLVVHDVKNGLVDSGDVVVFGEKGHGLRSDFLSLLFRPVEQLLADAVAEIQLVFRDISQEK